MNPLLIILGLLTIASAAGVVFSHKSMNSGLWLIVTLFLVAVHFIMLGAEFIGALQVLVYAGAIMVLFVFVIMLLGLDEKGERRRGFLTAALAVFSVVAFFAVFYFSSQSWFQIPEKPVALASSGDIGDIGHLLFTKYVLPFELVSMLILGALIGAVVIAFEPQRKLPLGRGLSAQNAKEVEGI